MRRHFLPLALALALAGCSRGLPHVPFEGRRHDLYPGAPQTGEDRYRVGVGDMLRLMVWRHAEFCGEVTVDATGAIALPLTYERMSVAGLTLIEVEGKLAEAIKPYVLQPPQVSVELADSESRFFYVLGDVNEPGKYPMGDERVYVREAVVRANWPKRTAALARARLVSSNPDKSDARKINLKRILLDGDLTENYELKPGDIVVVPRSFASAFVWHASQWLQPFAVLLGYDSMVTEFYDLPTVRHEARKKRDAPSHEDAYYYGSGVSRQWP
ncbi:MAG TPA: polysaccharide biosynthesis/export family protein [Sumerlaeia bacterium]|nr:polysaccharide biosynthesis/export family protein [Sumerlaeia bacterium]